MREISLLYVDKDNTKDKLEFIPINDGIDWMASEMIDTKIDALDVGN